MPEWLIFWVVKTVEYSKLKLWYFYNIKLISLLALVYINNYIKAHSLRWFGHVHQMTFYRMVEIIICFETDMHEISRKTKSWMEKWYKRFKNS